MNRRPALIFTTLFLWFTLILLACSIGPQNQEPPTLVPRATSTPPPTIGYATLAPNEYPDQTTQIAPVPVRPDTTLLSLMGQVDADRLYVTIDSLVGMRTRRVNSTGGTGQGIGAARDYLLNQFNIIRDNSYQNSFSVMPQDFGFTWDNTQSTGTNIIGILQGSDVGAGVYILGAHYDSISYNFTDSGAFAPGADDDASGIAALLEVARIMSQHRHRATIMFVAFSAEEIQRKGSVAFVSEYLQTHPNIDVKGMLNMDIIGSSTGPDGDINDREIRLFSADPNESNSRQLARALNLIAVRHVSDMKIVVQSTVDRPNRYSDHMSFSDAGYPAVRFIEALEDFSRQHSDRDTIDDVQATYLVRATKTILACMTALADGPPAPQNIQLRQNDDGTRTLVWEPAPGATAYVVALRRPDGLIYSDYFETGDHSVTWDGFVASRYTSLAIGSEDANGLMGSMSFEYAITS